VSEHADLRRLPVLDGADVARLLPYLDLVDGLEEGHRHTAPIVRRTVFGPDRSDQSFLGLPAWRPGDVLGVKLVTVFPANTAIPTVQALYVLFDGRDGAPLALIDGTELTYRKTACDSALGSRFLSRTDSRILLMVGAGGLAPHLVAAHRAVRPSLERVLIWNRNRDRAAAVASTLGAQVADDLGSAVEEADIVCTATMTKEALVEGRWLGPGTHLDLVGAYLPDHREVDDEAVKRAELYVDTREVTTEEDGDLVIPLAAGVITLDDIRGDLFQLCRGEVEGRTDPSAITLFENGGGGHLDLMAADLLWHRASFR
jgi:ornithine cyclodeaminase/alanine dehydrogenase-like protein (mu-crystallin family)